jgi:hypothetical protein
MLLQLINNPGTNEESTINCRIGWLSTTGLRTTDFRALAAGWHNGVINRIGYPKFSLAEDKAKKMMNQQVMTARIRDHGGVLAKLLRRPPDAV